MELGPGPPQNFLARTAPACINGEYLGQSIVNAVFKHAYRSVTQKHSLIHSHIYRKGMQYDFNSTPVTRPNSLLAVQPLE
jgi:hypothetical protein